MLGTAKRETLSAKLLHCTTNWERVKETKKQSEVLFPQETTFWGDWQHFIFFSHCCWVLGGLFFPFLIWTTVHTKKPWPSNCTTTPQVYLAEKALAYQSKENRKTLHVESTNKMEFNNLDTSKQDTRNKTIQIPVKNPNPNVHSKENNYIEIHLFIPPQFHVQQMYTHIEAGNARL